jgi:hypothetical protein
MTLATTKIRDLTLSAASGLVSNCDNFYVIADDALFLYGYSLIEPHLTKISLCDII